MVIRSLDENGIRGRYTFLVNGMVRGSAWESRGQGGGWTSQTIRDVKIRAGDDIGLDAEGAGGRLDYVELNLGAVQR